mmetsp:Transcript_6597/g.11590  ORF Transcript_6597/g.11590 Transcript_6597/m.11590 type:complete len:320 (-) Transcript_6597:1810-2769(-)
MAERLDLSQFEIRQTLGTGSFGRVRLVMKKGTRDYYALKILKKHDILRLKQVDHVYSEYSILRTLYHPFLVQLIGSAQDDRYLYFCLEYVQGGELFTYLRTIGKLVSTHAQVYAAQIVSMLEYMHSLNIVYRDLKPENLLIAADGYLKLTDFGFAKVVTGRTYTLCGTPEYLAPEILLNKGHGKPVDWWTLGIIIYEMVAGIDPFNDDDPMQIYQKILKGRVRFPRNFDAAAKSLVKHLLVSDLSKRFGNLKRGVEDIKTHRFFTGLDWQRLLNKDLHMPYIPHLTEASDASHFAKYPDSPTLPQSVRPQVDPFLQWDS